MINPKLKKRLSTYLAIGIVVFLLVFIGISKAMIDYTSNPSFCGGCHLMHTRFISYKRSVHNKATCLDCHSKPGIVGEIDAHLNGMKYLYYDIKGYRTTQIIHAEVDNKSCLRCHDISTMDEKIEKRVNQVQQTSHKSHVLNYNISCTECHGNIMHITLEGIADKKPTESCQDCHKQTDFVNVIDRLIF